jgi:hypothetical protein
MSTKSRPLTQRYNDHKLCQMLVPFIYVLFRQVLSKELSDLLLSCIHITFMCLIAME